MAEQFLLGPRTDTGDLRQLGTSLTLCPAGAMESYGETMAFVTNLLDQPQNGRSAVQDDGFVLAAGDVDDLLALGDAGKRLIDDVQGIQRGLRRVKLPDTAV